MKLILVGGTNHGREVECRYDRFRIVKKLPMDIRPLYNRVYFEEVIEAPTMEYEEYVVQEIVGGNELPARFLVLAGHSALDGIKALLEQANYWWEVKKKIPCLEEMIKEKT